MERYLCTLILCLTLALDVWGQFPPREEDRFWRRKLVHRIDFEEKANRPLINRESPYYRGELSSDSVGPQNRDGLVVALMRGLLDGHYTAYDPDDFKKQLDSRDVVDRIAELSASATAGAALVDSSEVIFSEEDDDFPSDEAIDPFSDPFIDPFDEDLTSPPGDSTTKPKGPEPGVVDLDALGKMPDTTPFESVIQVVEDRIFDKNRSAIFYDIQFIELIWVDPYGQLEDKKLCTFRYAEVMEVLENTQWKNRFNDAQYRNMRQVFEMRLFHSYLIDISGIGIQSLSEAEFRRQKMVEFEHHLWSY